MGLRKVTVKLIENAVKRIDKPLSEIRMCELGNQRLKKFKERKWGTAKKYFTSLGIKHISIDLNGDDGSLPYDLGRIIDNEKFVNNFDIVTNMGTSEHVFCQYACFANIHNFCKNGGFMVHSVPSVNNWKGHCQYRYTTSFFNKLAESFGYQIIRNKIGEVKKYRKEKLVWTILRKAEDSVFYEELFDLVTKTIPSWGQEYGKRKKGYSYTIEDNKLIVF